MAEKIIKNVASFPLRYGNYKDKKWFKRVRLAAAEREISINELIVRLLDAWLENKIDFDKFI